MVETEVALTLSYLADESRLQKISSCIAKSTVSIKSVYKAIYDKLAPEYISFSNCTEDIEEMVSKFYEHHGFQQCLGEIDGTHIQSKQPKTNAVEFINQKGR